MRFTPEKPKVPGAYWWRKSCHCLASVVEVRDECGLWAMGVGCVASMTGEWSERLIPVGEIRKAFDEGFADAHGIWEDSRARRVVEGKEEV